MAPQNSRSRLIVRTAKLSDIPAINRVVQRTYPKMDDYSFDELRGQINNFPEGQLVAAVRDAGDRKAGVVATEDLQARALAGTGAEGEATGLTVDDLAFDLTGRCARREADF